MLAKELPLSVIVPTTDAMHHLGERLAGLVRPGDLIIASGDLGAGKTTLTQGIGRGLGSIGPIISPTFVIPVSTLRLSVARPLFTSTPIGSTAWASSTILTWTRRSTSR